MGPHRGPLKMVHLLRIKKIILRSEAIKHGLYVNRTIVVTPELDQPADNAVRVP